MESEPKKLHKGWRMQFSLRTILILVTFVCVLLGMWITRLQKELQTADMLDRHGAAVLELNSDHRREFVLFDRGAYSVWNDLPVRDRECKRSTWQLVRSQRYKHVLLTNDFDLGVGELSNGLKALCWCSTVTVDARLYSKSELEKLRRQFPKTEFRVMGAVVCFD